METSSNRIISLDGEWCFALDPDRRGMGGLGVRLPGGFDPRTRLMGGARVRGEDEGKFYRHMDQAREYVGQAWYVKEIEIPAEWEGNQVELVRGVRWICEATLDGRGDRFVRVAGAHRFDLTPRPGGREAEAGARIDNEMKRRSKKAMPIRSIRRRHGAGLPAGRSSSGRRIRGSASSGLRRMRPQGR